MPVSRERIPEIKVALDFAIHIIDSKSVATVCPDGQQAKRFDIPGYLRERGFRRTEAVGGTSYGGVYKGARKQLTIDPRPGYGDVWADGLVAECKGAAINNDWGRTRVGVYEIVGKLMSLPVGLRHIAVLPRTEFTTRLIRSLLPRCTIAGIEFALVDESGAVSFIAADQED
jgi:hypothetical protein